MPFMYVRLCYLSVIQIRLYQCALEAGLHITNIVTVLERKTYNPIWLTGNMSNMYNRLYYP